MGLQTCSSESCKGWKLTAFLRLMATFQYKKENNVLLLKSNVFIVESYFRREMRWVKGREDWGEGCYIWIGIIIRYDCFLLFFYADIYKLIPQEDSERWDERIFAQRK